MDANAPATTDAAVLADPRWFPFGLDVARSEVLFQFAEREALAEKTFLDEVHRDESLPRHVMSVRAVEDAAAAPPPHLNFIWHSSLCCSTLLSRLIDVQGKNLSLREPDVLVRLAHAQQNPATRAALPYAGLLRLLARPFREGEAVTIKPNNFANNAITEIARFSAGKMLFLYSGLESYLLSAHRRGPAFAEYVRMGFSYFLQGGEMPWRMLEPRSLSEIKAAALVWHMQMAMFRRAMVALGPARALSLDCDAFLADPATALARLDAFFGLGLGADRIANAVSGELMNRHAKNSSEAFDAEIRRGRLNAVADEIGGAVRDAIAWSFARCPDAPRGTPLPHSLLTLEVRPS